MQRRHLLAFAVLVAAVGLLLLPTAGQASGTRSTAWSPNDNGGYTFSSTQNSQTFTLANSGSKATGMLSIALQNQSRYANFSITSNTCSGNSIGPKMSCTVGVSVARSNLEVDIAQLFATSKTTSATIGLVANPSVDVGLTFTTPSSTSISNNCPVNNGVPVSPCLTGDVSAHNSGNVPVTLTIHMPESVVSGSNGTAAVGIGSDTFTCTNPPFSSSRDCTGTVAAGATAVVVPVLVAGDFTMSDSASITASSVPDPNSSNDSVSFSLGST
jgi:hypothetical protein